METTPIVDPNASRTLHHPRHSSLSRPVWLNNPVLWIFFVTVLPVPPSGPTFSPLDGVGYTFKGDSRGCWINIPFYQGPITFSYPMPSGDWNSKYSSRDRKWKEEILHTTRTPKIHKKFFTISLKTKVALQTIIRSQTRLPHSHMRFNRYICIVMLKLQNLKRNKNCNW